MKLCERCNEGAPATHRIKSYDDEGKPLLDILVCINCAYAAMDFANVLSVTPLKKSA